MKAQTTVLFYDFLPLHSKTLDKTPDIRFLIPNVHFLVFPSAIALKPRLMFKFTVIHM